MDRDDAHAHSHAEHGGASDYATERNEYGRPMPHAGRSPGKYTLSQSLPPPRSGVPQVVHHVLHHAGSPLDGGTRGRMEQGFGADLGHVRVHADEQAGRSAAALDAAAYAVGRDIVFGAGQYRPGTPDGDLLLAHELAHVVQQGDAPGAEVLRKGLDLGEAGDVVETAADEAASAVVSGATGVARALRGDGAGRLRRSFQVPAPIPRTRSMFRSQHAVTVDATRAVFDGQGRVLGGRVRMGHTVEEVVVQAGASGVLQVYGSGAYQIDTGSVLEPGPDLGDFQFLVSWPYSVTPQGEVTIGEPQPPDGRMQWSTSGATRVIRNAASASMAPRQASGANPFAAAVILISTARGSGGAGVGPYTIQVPVSSLNDSSFQVGVGLRVRVDPASIRPAPTPVPAPVPTPAPAPAPVGPAPLPPFRRIVEIQFPVRGTDLPPTSQGALARWAEGLPDPVRNAIFERRLHIEVRGYASRSGPTDDNDRYSQGRAQTVAHALERTLMGDGHRRDLRVTWMGSLVTPPESAPYDPHWQRAEIRVVGE